MSKIKIILELLIIDTAEKRLVDSKTAIKLSKIKQRKKIIYKKETAHR